MSILKELINVSGDEMLSDDVAVALDPGRALLDQAAFNVTPGELDNHQIAVHGLIESNAKVGQSQSGFQVELRDYSKDTGSFSSCSRLM